MSDSSCFINIPHLPPTSFNLHVSPNALDGLNMTAPRKAVGRMGLITICSYEALKLIKRIQLDHLHIMDLLISVMTANSFFEETVKRYLKKINLSFVT